jgi:YidC/Oxa1 family membrane protein insertase
VEGASLVERRFALFLALTLLIWTGYIGLQMFLAPPPQPVAQQPEGEPAADEADPLTDVPADAADDPVPPGDAAEPAVPREAAAGPDAARASAALARGTVGSLDPASPYKLLVHWNNRGAAIERVELVGYWAVDYYSGHLGHLALADAESDGAIVHVVGPGTAAALAQPSDPSVKPGLQPADVIKSIDDVPVTNAAALTNYLEERTRPDQSVKLIVERKGLANPVTFTARLTRRPWRSSSRSRTSIQPRMEDCKPFPTIRCRCY